MRRAAALPYLARMTRRKPTLVRLMCGAVKDTLLPLIPGMLFLSRSTIFGFLFQGSLWPLGRGACGPESLDGKALGNPAVSGACQWSETPRRYSSISSSEKPEKTKYAVVAAGEPIILPDHFVMYKIFETLLYPQRSPMNGLHW